LVKVDPVISHIRFDFDRRRNLLLAAICGGIRPGQFMKEPSRVRTVLVERLEKPSSISEYLILNSLNKAFTSDVAEQFSKSLVEFGGLSEIELKIILAGKAKLVFVSVGEDGKEIQA